MYGITRTVGGITTFAAVPIFQLVIKLGKNWYNFSETFSKILIKYLWNVFPIETFPFVLYTIFLRKPLRLRKHIIQSAYRPCSTFDIYFPIYNYLQFIYIRENTWTVLSADIYTSAIYMATSEIVWKIIRYFKKADQHILEYTAVLRFKSRHRFVPTRKNWRNVMGHWIVIK